MKQSKVWMGAIAMMVALGPATVAAAANPIWLTRDGEPQATITFPADASETERFAARELQKYIEKISGARLPVQVETVVGRVPRIFIGRSTRYSEAPAALEGRDDDAFIVKRDWQDLVIAGATDRATLFAVYDFLEQELGVRWLGPGEVWEDIPEQPTIELGAVDRLEEPALRYRLMRESTGLQDAAGSFRAKVASWAVKHKVNVSRADRWWSEGDPLPDSLSGLPNAERNRWRQWLDPLTPRGEETPLAQVPYRAWNQLHGTGVYFLPAFRYFEENPEWYAKMPTGYRYEYEDTGRARTHLCLTHPETREHVAAELIEMFNRKPHKEAIMLGADGGDYFCQCDDCMALYSGRRWHRDGMEHTAGWIAFVNAVTERVLEHHPDKQIMTMGYRTATAPPRASESDPPHPHVVVSLATWSPIGCRMHSIGNDQCRIHGRFREVYEQWREVTPGGMMIYQYIPRGSMHRMAYSAARHLAEDIRYLSDRDLVGYEGQTDMRMWGTYGLVKYVVAKAMWDPQLDVDAVIADYCERAFRAAGEPMQAFYAALEPGLYEADCAMGNVYDALGPAVLAEAREHLDAAHAAAEAASDELAQRRLRTLEVELHFAELAVTARDMMRRARDDDDAELLGEAIERGQRAADFVREEAEREPHHALTPSSFQRQVDGWRRHLEDMADG